MKKFLTVQNYFVFGQGYTKSDRNLNSHIAILVHFIFVFSLSPSLSHGCHFLVTRTTKVAVNLLTKNEEETTFLPGACNSSLPLHRTL